MDKPTAMMILQALRPKDLNSSDPTVIEALVFLETDPELKAWWETQQAFDRRVAAKLKEVRVPEDLRSLILGGEKSTPVPRQPRFFSLLAIAAALAILCVAGSLLHTAMFGPLDRTDYVAATLPLLHDDSPTLGMVTPDRDKVRAWLKQRNAPMGTLPPNMANLTTLGCQKYFVHGHSVSLICFSMADGKEAHLFIVDQKALNDPPSKDSPEFDQVQGWSTAAWSDGKMSYLLATTAGPDELKQLL
jgi:hypothetical protein